VSEYTSAQLG